MSRALRIPNELPEAGGLWPPDARPLFVPAGISVVRTGPTTQVELNRLLADADSSDVSGVRLSPALLAAPRGWSRWLSLFGFPPVAPSSVSTTRFRRPF